MTTEQKTLVCASLKTQNLAQAMRDVIQAHTDGADAVEFRLEEFEASNEDEDLKKLFSFAKARNLLTIATCRNEKQSRILQMALASEVDLVDIDLKNLPQMPVVEKTRLIASHHDFHSTPSLEDLVKIVSNCFSHAEIAKVSCMSQGEEDNSRLLSLYKIFANKKLISLGMGEKGSTTRVDAFKAAAFLSYACLSKETATAPGQFTVRELIEAVKNAGEEKNIT